MFNATLTDLRMIMDRPGVEGYEVSASTTDVPLNRVFNSYLMYLYKVFNLLLKIHIGFVLRVRSLAFYFNRKVQQSRLFFLKDIRSSVEFCQGVPVFLFPIHLIS